MSPQTSFRRKIVYLAAIAGLLGLLSVLGRPSTVDTETAQGSRGGLLAQLREEHQLGQTELGEIDPTSETIRLCTFGLRGVALVMLWEKSNLYKMKKDWTSFSAANEQLIKLAPNFASVWRNQGWNLSYNISVEFDDFRQRYRWVIKGIEFMQRGIRYNHLDTGLLWEIAWTTAQKIGRADERRQFRRMFKADDDFHDGLPFQVLGPDPRDNWLVGKQWFSRAEDLHDVHGAPITGMSPVVFRSDAPMCQMKYAEALEKDGIPQCVFGERAEMAWAKAGQDWYRFGSIDIPTAFDIVIQLNDLDGGKNYKQAAREKAQQLDALAPGLRDEIRKRKRAALPEDQRRALDTPILERTPEQHLLADDAESAIEVTHEDVANEILRSNRPKDVKRNASTLAKQAKDAELMAKIIRRYRQPVAFENWRHRAQMEQREETRTARKLVYQAEQALSQNSVLAARDFFHRGAAAWREVLDVCAQKKKEETRDEKQDQQKDELAWLIADQTFIEDVNLAIQQYAAILDKLGEPFPEDFKLGQFVSAKVQDSPKARAARKWITQAEKPPAADDLDAARQAYERSFAEWRNVLDEFPSLLLLSDRTTCAELVRVINAYAGILGKLGEPFPEGFVLEDFIHAQVTHADETRAARRFASQAEQNLAEKNPQAAREAYENALAEWRKLLDRLPAPVTMSDREFAKELILLINQYKQTLDQLQQPLPDEFILQDAVDWVRRRQ